jgi:2-dehydro-3-deoxyphosphogluconate aldolase/(4S)-4-hydroxy-2-oxoglutarate aldolase
MSPPPPKQAALIDILSRAPVIPVLTIEDPDFAVPLAVALRDGGLPVLEVTLRTTAAFEALRRITGEVEGIVAGAGTVLEAEQISGAMACGAAFLVSPGATPRLLDAAEDARVPMLPGAATASEAMHLYERGFARMKFFPAEAAGGIAYLKALAAPLPELQFCPTGGITLANAPDYLALANVVCVGSSWVAPAARIEAGDWAAVTALAREAAALRRPALAKVG